MNIKLWLPFVLAPLIGGIIGLQLFEAGRDEPMVPGAQPDAVKTGTVAMAGELANIFDRSAPAATQLPDTEAAFNAALSQAPDPSRLPVLQAAFVRWLLQAPAQALANINRIPSDERQEVVAHGLALLAQQRPGDFLNYANGMTDNYTNYMAAAMGVLAESHARLALELVQRNQGRADPHGVIIGAILPGLIRNDLALAADTIAAMQDRASIAHLQQVAAAYAQHDPKQAYDWVRRVLANRTDIAPTQILNDIAGSLVARNPADAAAYLNRTTDPVIRKSLLAEISIQKGQEDLTAAWTWLDQYRGDAQYGETALNLLYRWSYIKPEEVAKLLPKVADAQVQSMAATHLSRFWRQKDPTGYQVWIASLPPGAIKNSAMQP